VKEWVRDRLDLGIGLGLGLVLTVAVSDLGSGNRKANLNRHECPRIQYITTSITDFEKLSRKIVNAVISFSEYSRKIAPCGIYGNSSPFYGSKL